MIRKIVSVSIIFLFIFGICLTEQLISQEYFGVMGEKTANIITILSTTEDLNSKNIPFFTDDLASYWKAKENILATFINNKEIEDIGIELNKLKTALNNSNKESYEESINLIKFYIKSYEHLFGVNFQNIF